MASMSRLGFKALSEPGGILVSRAVRDQIRDKLDVALADRGSSR